MAINISAVVLISALSALFPAGVSGATLVHDADPLGRLFTTPQERRKLDELREQAARAGTLVIPEDVPELEETPVGEQPATPEIEVKGVVSRRDGPDAAWINDGNTMQMDSAAQVMKVEVVDSEGDSVRLGMPDQETSHTVRVGETFEPQDEKIVDLIDAYSNPDAPAHTRPGQTDAQDEQ